MRGQRVPERGVGDDGGVPNPVDRRDRVPDRDGVQPRHCPAAKTRALICKCRWRCGSPAREV